MGGCQRTRTVRRSADSLSANPGPVVKHDAVAAECHLALAFTKMGRQNPTLVRHFHATGGLEVRIAFGLADLPHVDVRERGKTVRETAIGPHPQPTRAEHGDACSGDPGATVTVTAKAGRILDETVRDPSQ